MTRISVVEIFLVRNRAFYSPITNHLLRLDRKATLEECLDGREENIQPLDVRDMARFFEPAAVWRSDRRAQNCEPRKGMTSAMPCRGARSTDYPFTYVELRVDQNGRGDGMIIPAARVRSRGSNTLEFEDFGTFPGRLMGVRMRGSRLQ